MTDVLGVVGRALWEAVLPGIGTVLGMMALVVFKNFLAKQGLDLTDKQEQRLKQIVVDKIHATEEAAHRTPLTGIEKNAKTVNDVIVAATDDPQIPNPSLEKVAAVVDSELAKARVEGYLPNPGLPGLGKR